MGHLTGMSRDEGEEERGQEFVSPPAGMEAGGLVRVPVQRPRLRSGNYPKSVADVLDPEMEFEQEAVNILRRFKSSRPWKGSRTEKYEKFQGVLDELCDFFQVERVVLKMGGQAHYIEGVVVIPKFTVVSLLHEFRHHVMGHNEFDACRWSINLFRLIFPKAFEKLDWEGHLLVKRDIQQKNLLCPECGRHMDLVVGRWSRYYRCIRWPGCNGAYASRPDGSPFGIVGDDETARLRTKVLETRDNLLQFMPQEEIDTYLQKAVGNNSASIEGLSKYECRSVLSIFEDLISARQDVAEMTEEEIGATGDDQSEDSK